METSELKEELFEEFGDRYSDPRSLWESIYRYLDDHPGFADGGYGAYAYAGDDDLREELRVSSSDE